MLLHEASGSIKIRVVYVVLFTIVADRDNSHMITSHAGEENLAGVVWNNLRLRLNTVVRHPGIEESGNAHDRPG